MYTRAEDSSPCQGPGAFEPLWGAWSAGCIWRVSGDGLKSTTLIAQFLQYIVLFRAIALVDLDSQHCNVQCCRFSLWAEETTCWGTTGEVQTCPFQAAAWAVSWSPVFGHFGPSFPQIAGNVAMMGFKSLKNGFSTLKIRGGWVVDQ